MMAEVRQHRDHRGRRCRGFAGGLFFAMETIFIALLAVTGISSCPRKCQCIWRDSKITVDCSDQELAAIPTTVEANTQVSNTEIYFKGKITTYYIVIMPPVIGHV